MFLPIMLDDQSKLLVAVGIGIVLGVLLGSWFIALVQRLILGVVKVALLAAVLVGAVFLWNEYRSTEQPPAPVGIPIYQSGTPAIETYAPTPPAEIPASAAGRWWEQ
jgi:hypothetical protein